MLTTLRDATDGDEADVVNILINALTRENPDKIGQSCDTDKLRKGLGRVSFESPKAIVPNVDHLPSKSVRTSVVIPNAPVNKDHQTLLDTLADLACSKSPVRTKGNSKSDAGQKNWRPRAMSEPWLVDDFRSLSGAGSSMSGNITEISSPFNLLSDSLSVLVPVSLPHAATSADLQASGNSVPLSVPLGIAAWASRNMKPKTALPVASSLSTSTSVNTSAHLQGYGAILPQILEGDYRTVYNKNGRIGIYTREERQRIIRRFQDKRRNRVWKKKIRYHCRKNLADRRVRIKGRFVRAADGSSPLEGSFDSDAGLSVDLNRNTRSEGEIDGVTSSEEGEGEAYPMEVVEASSVSVSDYTKESLCANIGIAAVRDSDHVVSSATQSAGDASLVTGINTHSKSRGKQQCGEGHGTASMGSAMDGMKAFWGAIHEAPSTTLQSPRRTHVADTQDTQRGEVETEPLAPSKEESEEEVDEVDGLWTENGESLANGSESKKRFRRYTIAY